MTDTSHDPVVGLLAALLPSQCVAKYFPSGSSLAPAVEALLDVPCAKLVISKVLGYGIVAGSALVKMPQILKIMRAASVAGLSGASINIEMLASTCSFAYYIGLGYPFSTWGENLFLFLQNAVIVTLYFGYSRGSFVSPAYVAAATAFAAVGASLYLRLLPTVAMPAGLCASLELKACELTSEGIAGGLPILLLLFSRLPQIVQNFQQGHTGMLAVPTYALNTLGSLARVFTILQEVNDVLVLGGTISAFLQNFTIILQMVLYRSANRKRAEAAEQKAR
jgi:mannose-P-dolichol utilization defect protein 1